MAGHPTPFRFVHTADLHLDSPLKSLASRDPALADAVATASRTALARTVDLCLDEAVDALLIAGDLYDSTQRSMHTAAALTREMRRLHEADVPVCLIQGNHDAGSQITRELALPPNVLTFTGRGGTHLIGGSRAAVHGVSFARPKVPESLLPKFPGPVPDCWNVGLLHTSLAGAEGHDDYAPCALEELVNFGYDYWALGHVHKRRVHRADAPAVVMPGNPQGRDMGEDGARGVTLVTLADGAPARLEEHVVGPARFERLALTLDGAETWQSLLGRLDDALVERRGAIDVEHLIVRVELRGRSTLAPRLARDRDLVALLLQETADGLGGTWIEKVTSEVRMPGAGGGDADDALGPVLHRLGALIDDELFASPELRRQVDQDVAEFLKKLPKELRHMLGEDETARVDALLREGSAELLLRIGSDDAEPELDGEALEETSPAPGTTSRAGARRASPAAVRTDG